MIVDEKFAITNLSLVDKIATKLELHDIAFTF